MINVLTVIGTRPEAIKLAPVVMELRRRADRFNSKICLTAQHRDMADQVLAVFELHPDFDLDVMSHGQTLAQVTARIVERLDRVVELDRPDVVLVQGDTTTAMCGGLVGFYHRARVGHVEAGLRTGNKFAPYPEEMNRRLVAPLADFHFAPTEAASAALRREGICDEAIFLTGNTVIDALLWMRDRVDTAPSPEIPQHIVSALDGRPMVLVTGHRRENFGAGFENICRAIREVADLVADAVFVYPVHLNPNVRAPVNRILAQHDRIFLVEPLSYGPFVWLMNHATIVLTDSGGVQEEAPSLGKPVLVMRETTERPEGIAAGNARLVGVQQHEIVSAVLELLSNDEARAKMTSVSNPYGDGQASRRITDVLEQKLWTG